MCGMIDDEERAYKFLFRNMSIAQHHLSVNDVMSRTSRTRIVNRLGEKLKALRLRRGLTTRALAEALQAGYGAISDIENGKRQPNVDLVQKAAVYFGISADDLLDDEREV